jgi:hypothetical protein
MLKNIYKFYFQNAQFERKRRDCPYLDFRLNVARKLYSFFNKIFYNNNRNKKKGESLNKYNIEVKVCLDAPIQNG